MACSNCGDNDHNIQTCPKARRCSVCGKTGHNSATCAYSLATEDELEEEIVNINQITTTDEFNDAVKLAAEDIKDIPSERRIFLAVVGNEPGPGAPVVNPLRNGFVRLDEISSENLRELVENTDRISDIRKRKEYFQAIISMVHKLAPNFEVYIGRTYIRETREEKGLRERFTSHYNSNKKMIYGRPIFAIKRDYIENTERLAIRLVKIWHDTGILCCNNTVLSNIGRLSEDEWQLIYICIKAKS